MDSKAKKNRISKLASVRKSEEKNRHEAILRHVEYSDDLMEKIARKIRVEGYKLPSACIDYGVLPDVFLQWASMYEKASMLQKAAGPLYQSHIESYANEHGRKSMDPIYYRTADKPTFSETSLASCIIPLNNRQFTLNVTDPDDDNDECIFEGDGTNE